MELMYPIAIIICLIFVVAVFFIKPKANEKYVVGKKVANTNYIKETSYYKVKMKEYKILTNILKVISICCILVTSFLIARPITIQTKSEEKFNRDIMIGLDISLSENEVNLELIKKFKKILPNIQGDRVGIVIFNTAPVVYCPLTDDYDYLNECLDTIEKELQIVIDNGGKVPFSFDKEGMKTHAFWYGGILDNSDERGSSLVGDGLAGTIYSFPDIKTKKDRTRIIIFATDNDVSGKEAVSLDDACKLCKKYNINLYAYCPTVEMNKYTSAQKIATYKTSVEQSAGGKFYNGDLNNMSSNIVNEIKETKTTLLKTSKKTFVTDHPEIAFLILTGIFAVLIIIEKRIKL